MTKTLKIEGMMCEHCAKHVKKALEEVNGVKTAQIDLGQKQAVIDCEEAVTDQALKTAVAEAGYQLTDIA